MVPSSGLHCVLVDAAGVAGLLLGPTEWMLLNVLQGTDAPTPENRLQRTGPDVSHAKPEDLM